MAKKIAPSQPEIIPAPQKPELNPPKDPEEPLSPEPDPEILPDPDPDETRPYEIPPPGEGP